MNKLQIQEKFQRHKGGIIGGFLVVVAILLILSFIPFTVKPAWCTFRKLLRDKKVGVRGSGSDTNTLSISQSKFPQLYAVFSNTIIGDGSTKNYQDKTYTFENGTKLMKKKGLVWQGEGMRSGKIIYIPECSYNSPSFPWVNCLKALELPVPQQNFWNRKPITFKPSVCFDSKPSCKTK